MSCWETPARVISLEGRVTEGRELEVITLGETHQSDERAQADNPAGRGNGAFEDLMRNHCGQLIQSLSLVALDRETAADAAQDAFLELHLHFDEVRDPVPWLYRVAFNRCLDSRRRFARRVRLLERLVGVASPEDWIAPAMAHTDFSEVLVKLPLRQRTAATLYYLADLSVSEIAATMNVSEGSVNRHLYRARETLRNTLEAN
jgi:RNA polymerase sigma-70 factor (ECF subfamily)